MTASNPDHALLATWRAPVSAAGCNPLAARLAMTIDHVDRTAGVVRLGFAPAEAAELPAMPAIAAMLDFALGFAAMATLAPPDRIVTSTLRIERVASFAASSFEATGTVVGANDATIFTRAELRDERGRLLALATATQRRVYPP